MISSCFWLENGFVRLKIKSIAHLHEECCIVLELLYLIVDVQLEIRLTSLFNVYQTLQNVLCCSYRTFYVWATCNLGQFKSLERQQLSCAPPQCEDWTHSSGSLDKPVGFDCHYLNLQTFLNCLQSNTSCWSHLHWHEYNYVLQTQTTIIAVSSPLLHTLVCSTGWMTSIIHALTNKHRKYCIGNQDRQHTFNERRKHTCMWHTQMRASARTHTTHAVSDARWHDERVGPWKRSKGTFSRELNDEDSGNWASLHKHWL